MRNLFYWLTLLWLSISSAVAQVYKWVDGDGRVHYSNIQPPPPIKFTTKQKLGDNTVEISRLPYATKEAAKKNPIILFTSEACVDLCNQAIALLDQRGVPYTVKNTDKNDVLLKNLMLDFKVPYLIVGKQPPYKGLMESDWQRMIDNGGYPKIKSVNNTAITETTENTVSNSRPTTLPTSVFHCDGRIYCSQMKSCEEAKFFLENCPGVKMDGGKHDGVPCERQWCGR